MSYKRLFLTSDWHFGCRSNSKEWLSIQRDYFYEIFIPFLKSKYQPGDVVLHLGDVYDNRQSIEQQINDVVIDIVEEISKIMPMYIIAGNHDIYRKNSNNITSLKNLKFIPNVTVLQEPETFEWSGKKCMLMPWRKDHHHAKEELDQAEPGDYLFAHFDVTGARFNRNVEIEDGVVVDQTFKFKKI